MVGPQDAGTRTLCSCQITRKVHRVPFLYDLTVVVDESNLIVTHQPTTNLAQASRDIIRWYSGLLKGDRTSCERLAMSKRTAREKAYFIT